MFGYYFFFKQKTAYEMRISDWRSDVCSSDLMGGTKAAALDRFCADRGQAFLRFDYMGHGDSSGNFADGTIGRWTADALAVLDGLTEGPQILVGSSMGGWIMLNVALARAQRIAALVGIAAAPDFTETIWQGLGPDGQARSEEHTSEL